MNLQSDAFCQLSVLIGSTDKGKVLKRKPRWLTGFKPKAPRKLTRFQRQARIFLFELLYNDKTCVKCTHSSRAKSCPIPVNLLVKININY